MEKSVVAGTVRKAAKDVEETRTIEFVASDNSRDSHGTIVPADKWDLDRFNKNGIIGYQHNVYGDMCGNEDPDRVIGTGVARVENDELIIAVTFEPAELNELAEKIFRKVLHGTLKAVSVGFAATEKGYWGEGEEAERGENPTYYFNGQELLELSIVNIPSNKNALKRNLRNNTVDAISFIYRALDGRKRFSEIEDMTVRDVLDAMEKRVLDPKSDNVNQQRNIKDDESGKGTSTKGADGSSEGKKEGVDEGSGETAEEKQKALAKQKQIDEDFALSLECECELAE